MTDALAETDFRFDPSAPKPQDFRAEDWTIIKRAGRIVCARHTSGIERKMPASWLEH